ncbi:hypothetical protein DPMN_075234 [Dreissena polymorpha]|uniref:Uncharacterized protein n=1 Tax=Dreissena polymorpha TaxID=45954 RepID=A0A9D4BMG0_DREPO|nr:hypothetical protein DPMN_075234 [Dreissena polymorpha]
MGLMPDAASLAPDQPAHPISHVKSYPVYYRPACTPHQSRQELSCLLQTSLHTPSVTSRAILSTTDQPAHPISLVKSYPVYYRPACTPHQSRQELSCLLQTSLHTPSVSSRAILSTTCQPAHPISLVKSYPVYYRPACTPHQSRQELSCLLQTSLHTPSVSSRAILSTTDQPAHPISLVKSYPVYYRPACTPHQSCQELSCLLHRPACTPHQSCQELSCLLQTSLHTPSVTSRAILSTTDQPAHPISLVKSYPVYYRPACTPHQSCQELACLLQTSLHTPSVTSRAILSTTDQPAHPTSLVKSYPVYYRPACTPHQSCQELACLLQTSLHTPSVTSRAILSTTDQPAHPISLVKSYPVYYRPASTPHQSRQELSCLLQTSLHTPSVTSRAILSTTDQPAHPISHVKSYPVYYRPACTPHQSRQELSCLLQTSLHTPSVSSRAILSTTDQPAHPISLVKSYPVYYRPACTPHQSRQELSCLLQTSLHTPSVLSRAILSTTDQPAHPISLVKSYPVYYRPACTPHQSRQELSCLLQTSLHTPSVSSRAILSTTDQPAHPISLVKSYPVYYRPACTPHQSRQELSCLLQTSLHTPSVLSRAILSTTDQPAHPISLVKSYPVYYRPACTPHQSCQELSCLLQTSMHTPSVTSRAILSTTDQPAHPISLVKSYPVYYRPACTPHQSRQELSCLLQTSLHTPSVSSRAILSTTDQPAHPISLVKSYPVYYRPACTPHQSCQELSCLLQTSLHTPSVSSRAILSTTDQPAHPISHVKS